MESSLAFFPRFPLESEPSFTILNLRGKLELVDMTVVRENYIVAICFDASESNGSYILVAIHIPNREEIGRIRFSCGRFGTRHRLIQSSTGGTIALELGGGYGIIMTGEDLRGLGRSRQGDSEDNAGDSSNTKGGSKKKKNPRSKKGGKKDGFARGMSLRG
jgi:hypothetical protein